MSETTQQKPTEQEAALSAQVLLVSNLYPRQTTQNATAIRHGWERLDKAHADLLAEVRRLQQENERLRTPAPVETLDDDALDTRDWLETAARVFRGVVASAERGADARLISSQDDIDDARCMADAIERVVRDLDWAREGYRRDVEDTLSQVSDADAEINDLRQQLASAHEETAQAVRAERDACASDLDEMRDNHVGGAFVLDEATRDALTLASDTIRSRSLPGETADA